MNVYVGIIVLSLNTPGSVPAAADLPVGRVDQMNRVGSKRESKNAALISCSKTLRLPSMGMRNARSLVDEGSLDERLYVPEECDQLVLIHLSIR
jgi:hypothetical protein